VYANGNYAVRFSVQYNDIKQYSEDIIGRSQKSITGQVPVTVTSMIVRVQALFGLPVKWRQIGIIYSVPPGTYCYETTGTGFKPDCKEVNCS
jgi:hypothetical protein